MRTALVTGAEGFVGRHIAAELDRRGYSVDLADITMDIDALDVFRAETWVYDLVVHAAAVSPHRAAIDECPEIFPANVMLDAAMFAWATRTHQRRVLYFSSCAAYPGSLQHGPVTVRFREHMIGRHYSEPDDTYGWTKLTGERMAASARAAGVPVTVVRPFSGYGEDQSEDFPFRALMERARRREDPFSIWGTGEQVRDWIHIDDLVAGALAMTDAGVDEPVNLCTGRGTSVAALAQLACDHVGYQPAFRYVHHSAGAAYRVGSPAIMNRIYTAQITVEDGVKRALT